MLQNGMIMPSILLADLEFEVMVMISDWLLILANIYQQID